MDINELILTDAGVDAIEKGAWVGDLPGAPGVKLKVIGTASKAYRKAIQAKELLKRSTNEKLGRITASFGVAQFSPTDNAMSFIERADQCLYAAKRAGRNRVVGEDELVEVTELSDKDVSAA